MLEIVKLQREIYTFGDMLYDGKEKEMCLRLLSQRSPCAEGLVGLGEGGKHIIGAYDSLLSKLLVLA